MASGCARVVERVEAAKDNGGYLDLSNCQLTQVPDAVFLLMKNVNIHSCNLSNNLITKIPPKLPNNFCLIKVLDLSNNKLTSLPREMTNCSMMETLDMSWTPLGPTNFPWPIRGRWIGLPKLSEKSMEAPPKPTT